LFLFLKSRNQHRLAIGWIGIILLGIAAQYRFGLYKFGNDDVRILPGPRVVLNAPSPAIGKIMTDRSTPFRVMGLKWNLVGDYSAAYEIEDIRSCAPLSNPELIRLLQDFPGMQLAEYWVVQATNLPLAQPLLSLLNVKYM